MPTTCHEGLQPLPSDPTPAIKILLTYFTPTPPDVCCALHAAHELVGVGLAYWDECPERKPVAAACPEGCNFEAELKKAKDALCGADGARASATPDDVKALPWSLLISLALDFIMKLLNR